MADDTIHIVESCWLPPQLRNKVWTTFEDPSLIEVGTVFFDPASYAHYAGIVEVITEANGTKYARMHWYKGIDNSIHESIPLERFATLHLWWADPVMQDG